MRTAISTSIALSILVGPFFATLALMVFGLLYYPRYFEVVVAATVIELLYHGRGGVFGAWGALTLTLFAAFLAVEILRMYIRTQPR